MTDKETREGMNIMAIKVLEILYHNVGEIVIEDFYEDGFMYTRKTDYMKVRGIAEYAGSCKDMLYDLDYHKWTNAEVVIERYK